MTNVLIVTKRLHDGEKWPVSLHDERDYRANEAVGPPPSTIGWVSTWPELHALADQHDADTIDGDGLDEMEDELGPQPDRR